MPAKLANKWVVITGASSGFGAAATLAFAREGSKLVLGARRVDRLEAVAAQARKAGAPAALVHALDVAETKSVNDYVGWLRSHTDKIDVLINNAGGAKGLDKVADGRDDDWEFMLQTNVLGVLRMTRACLPLMVNNPGGYILNVGSVAGRTAYEGGAAYCGAKAAELKITQALRLELCGTGLRVGTVDPGMAETEFSLVRFNGDTERANKVYEGVVPLTADDVADALVWAASRPPHVCVDEMVLKCTDQAAVHKVHRRTQGK
ncbi:MAG TPA: SDR family NAD(P)-dependent oxidoreductase [Verrucomicrobiae bacterium]|nr:SDR family NAD(P)-dependent oxidoreductase [Verrucomicrobiae bacterium]